MLTDDPKLSLATRKLIADAEEVFVSSARIWEASIKVGLRKLVADVRQLVAEMEPCGFKELPVRSEHAVLVSELPNFHRDPFDRILIAQAISEPLRLITADGNLLAYSELVICI